MAYPKGKPRPEGAGRKKGVPNKVTGDIREMIRASLERVGGIEYLMAQAQANPSAYMALVAKVVPKEIEANVSGSVTLVDEFGK